MSITINEEVATRLRDEQIVWLTTIREDLTPLPTPVWFLWDGTSFLIFSQPSALKVRNIAKHPKVAVNLRADELGGNVVVFTGEAYADPAPVPPAQLEAYLQKYREGIKMLEMTPESLLGTYSTALRVVPTRVRVGV